MVSNSPPKDIISNLFIVYRSCPVIVFKAIFFTFFLDLGIYQSSFLPDFELLDSRLYGVGVHISNAVLCFAFLKRVPIVDINEIKVYGRVFKVKSLKSCPRFG